MAILQDAKADLEAAEDSLQRGDYKWAAYKARKVR